MIKPEYARSFPLAPHQRLKAALRWALFTGAPVVPFGVGLAVLMALDSPIPLVVFSIVLVTLVGMPILLIAGFFVLWAFAASTWKWLERPWSGLLVGAVGLAAAILVPVMRGSVIEKPRLFLTIVGVAALWIRLGRSEWIGLAPGIFATQVPESVGGKIGAGLRLMFVCALVAGGSAITVAVGSLVRGPRPPSDAELWRWHRDSFLSDAYGPPVEWDRVLRSSNALLERFPYEPEPLEHRGLARVALRDTVEGLKDIILASSLNGCGGGRNLLRQLEQEPNAARIRSAIWTSYAGCERGLEQFADAESAYLRALESGDSAAYYGRGTMRLALGDTVSACADWRMGLKHHYAADPAIALEAVCSLPLWQQRASTRLAHQKGVVESFRESKGYGYISPDGGSRTIFVESSAVLDTPKLLRVGERVEFEIGESSNGYSAEKVKRVQ